MPTLSDLARHSPAPAGDAFRPGGRRRRGRAGPGDLGPRGRALVQPQDAAPTPLDVPRRPPCCSSRCTRWRWPASAARGYKGDPWLQRTSHFLATTTFGTIDTEATIERVRGIHERVRGRDPKGRPYRASDPPLLRWVHVAEAHSFLTGHQRYALDR